MPVLPRDIPVTILADGIYELAQDIDVLDPLTGLHYEIKRGFRSDLASVPRFLTWLTPVAGALDLAAFLHDRNCVELANAYREHRAPDISSVDTDGLFYRCLRDAGIGSYLAHAYWVGVRIGAVRNPARRQGWGSTFWEVLFWTMLLLPVAPAALLTGLTLGVGRVLTPSHPTSRTLTRTAFAARRTP